MENRIKEIVVEILKLEEGQASILEKDNDLLQLGLDSLTSVEIVVNLENEFDIIIDDEDLLVENMGTIQLLMNLVSKYLEE